ncbi:MAG: GNAT family protein [Chloroflexota bacterium]
MATKIRLKTNRLILREYSRSDIESVHAYAKDPEVVSFMTWGPNTIDQTQSFIELTIAQQGELPRLHYHFAVVQADTKIIIGGCGIHFQSDNLQIAYIGYTFNRYFWGHGFASESAKCLLQFGFEEHNANRIWATCDPENTASARVLEKVGMQREGRLREHKWHKGAWRDSYLYAILAHEWKPLDR